MTKKNFHNSQISAFKPLLKIIFLFMLTDLYYRTKGKKIKTLSGRFPERIQKCSAKNISFSNLLKKKFFNFLFIYLWKFRKHARIRVSVRSKGFTLGTHCLKIIVYRGRHEQYPSKFREFGYRWVPFTEEISVVGYRWVPGVEKILNILPLTLNWLWVIIRDPACSISRKSMKMVKNQNREKHNSNQKYLRQICFLPRWFKKNKQEVKNLVKFWDNKR